MTFRRSSIFLIPTSSAFPPRGSPRRAPFRGRDAFERQAASTHEVFDERTVEALEYVDLGEYVAIVARITSVGMASRAPVSMEEVWLVRFRNGKCVEYRECGTKDRALELADLGREE